MTHNKNRILELRDELSSKITPRHSLKEIKTWYKNIIQKSNTKVKRIDLSDCSNWEMNKKIISHKSKKFFKVEALRITNSYKREIVGGWDQPILTEPGYKGGLLGLLRKEINGVPHYLINAKFEPGNYRLIQLSPTLQATFSNISQAHKGNTPRFLKYFTDQKKNKCKIFFKQWFSEEGGRLYNKRNLGILLNHNSHEIIKIDSDFKWVTLKQIKQLILENAMVNPHLRGLVSFI
jgi:oxidase EvaA